ncbi:MAG: hypothetical protein H6713_38930 [Myxococcales bacterium]|nr:hypothetical protein [Myxococcales bacterium]MCB9755934.1 hypothetical protein [Myxococcales bacterium]
MSHTTRHLPHVTPAVRVPTYAVCARFLAAQREREPGRRTLRRFTEVLDVVLEHLSAQRIGAVEFATARGLHLESVSSGRFARVIHVETLIAILETLVGDTVGVGAPRRPIAVDDLFGRFVVRALVCWIRDEDARLRERRATPPVAELPSPARRAPSTPAARPRGVWAVNPALQARGVCGLPVAV